MAGMAGLVVAMMGIAGLGILLTMLLPGVGFIAAALVVLLGGGSVAWLVLAVANGRSPTRPRRVR